MKMNDNFLKIAKEAALEAGKVISSYIGKENKKEIKDGDSSNFATIADVEAEAVIKKIIIASFPQHSIIAEESGKIDNSSEYIWVVDPLDGTLSFEHNVPFFCVSIGLLKNNIPILGVIYRVSTGDLFWAEQDKGAFLNGERLMVSTQQNLDESVVIVDMGHKQRRPAKLDLYIKPMVNRVGYIYSFGSAVLTLGFVATGMVDAGVSQAWIWDFAAASVILTEAGGKVTDLEGNESDWTKERLNIVASNGLLHDQILVELKRI